MASKVAVIMGGTSFERNFSLLSGRLVSESLARSGFDVLTLDADAHLVDTLRAEKPDVAFICMHGAGGEDGAVPALLEFLRIPYVGSRPASCRAAWNKADMANMSLWWSGHRSWCSPPVRLRTSVPQRR